VDLSEGEYRAGQQFVRARRERQDEGCRAAERALRLQSDQIEDRLSKLADLLLDGALEHSLYEMKQKTLLMQQAPCELDYTIRIAEAPPRSKSSRKLSNSQKARHCSTKRHRSTKNENC
jgi:hypothetical protein